MDSDSYGFCVEVKFGGLSMGFVSLFMGFSGEDRGEKEETGWQRNRKKFQKSERERERRVQKVNRKRESVILRWAIEIIK